MKDDGAPEEAGSRVEAWIFLGVGVFVLAIFAIYAATAEEPAGATMLLLGAGLGAMSGGYLLREAKRKAEPAAVGGNVEAAEEAYLPHASVWPLGLGFGLVLMANGLALGAWALIPGAMLTAGSVYGYARQSRNRS